jgi:hypothetical protein
MQTRKHSVVESIANTMTGYLVSLCASLWIYPLMGWPVTFVQANIITLFFTVLSIGRNYAVRRVFNRRAYECRLRRNQSEG